jgi:hypothetical protein
MQESDNSISDPSHSKSEGPTGPVSCACNPDPLQALPPELRPKPIQKIAGLRKTKCPGCGLSYWTHRVTDECMDCEAGKPP